MAKASHMATLRVSVAEDCPGAQTLFLPSTFSFILSQLGEYIEAGIASVQIQISLLIC